MTEAKSYQRNGPGELAADWEFGTGVHARDRLAIVRGIVEYNRDPDRRGRVMVRTVHDGPEINIVKDGDPRVPTFTLGWCTPLFGHGGGMGFGSFTVPPVGARVYVMYEHGDPENGVYFGGWIANAPKQRRYGETETTLNPPLKPYEDMDGFDTDGELGGDYYYPPKPAPYQGNWMEEQGPEMPLELADMLDHTPDTQLFFKTLKGASLLVKERDEAEELVLTDRMGAELRFESNTTLKEDGVERRGRVSGTQHEPMALDKLAYGRHLLGLVTAVGAGLDLQHTTWDENYATLQTHPESALKKNNELQPTRMVLELDEAEGRLRILYREDGETTGEINFDARSRRIDIRGLDRMQLTTDKELVIEAPNVQIIGDVDVRGEVRHWGQSKHTYFDMDNTPYGTPTRNYWPFDEPLMPFDDEVEWGRHKQELWENK